MLDQELPAGGRACQASFDITTLTEAEVQSMDEVTVLDLDESLDLHGILVDRLEALPRDHFKSVYASCLADLRDFYCGQINSSVRTLIERTIELTDRRAAAEVLDGWKRHFELDDDHDGNAIGVESETIEAACTAFAEEMAYGTDVGAADALADSAEQACDDDEPGVNIRLTLRFIARAATAHSMSTAISSSPD
ncbi:hypothetical protein HDA40_000801 [Hamadaea flava]|uniref:Uncharacterized protein n=1 Tax=Hamadaea flava TaxID=1742688 RepID=A0ABV8LTE7_9ACTN|nr:hypothetical protein [Hamadaea flava]MCP2322294.1 hypothetical protein [Hamadaea flava]